MKTVNQQAEKIMVENLIALPLRLRNAYKKLLIEELRRRKERRIKNDSRRRNRKIKRTSK